MGAVRAGIRAGLVLAVLSTLCGLGLAIAAPYMLRGMSADTAVELRQGLLVALVGFIWVPLIAFRPLAEAGQRGYVVQAALIAQTWLTTGLVIGLAIAGAGLLGQFLAVALGNGVTAILLLWDALRRYPGIVSQTASVAALPVAFSGSMFAFNLLSRIGLHSDSIIVGLTLGPGRGCILGDAAVDPACQHTGFGTGIRDVGRAGGNAPPRPDRAVQSSTYATHAADRSICIPLARAGCSSDRVIRWSVGRHRTLWGRSTHPGHRGIRMDPHTVSASGLALDYNRPRAVDTADLLSGNPTERGGEHIRIALDRRGRPALGSAMSLAALWFWWLPWILRREFGTPLRPLARAVAAPAAIGIPLCVGLYLLAALFPIHELPIPLWGRWCVLVGSMAVAATVYFILAWFFVLPREDRNELRRRLRLG